LDPICTLVGRVARLITARSAEDKQLPQDLGCSQGLHSGYIVATSQSDLLEELSQHTGEFTVGTVVDRTEDAELNPGQFDLLPGEIDGRAFLIDTSMVLSDSPDMVVAMSARLGTVLGCGAETVSGCGSAMRSRDPVRSRRMRRHDRYQRTRPGTGRYAQTGILDRVPPS
jgi:hypothetical protein